jgi:uncharacterized protein (DUF433 family)
MNEWRLIEPCLPPPRDSRLRAEPRRGIVDAIFCTLRGGGSGGERQFQPERPEPSYRAGQERMTVIRKTPGVGGAAACIGDSGVPVWIIVTMSEAGACVAEMLAAYPQLTAADCAAALNYALLHRAEIDADIAWGKAGA